MKRYSVLIGRTVEEYKTVIVTAKNKDAAEELALKICDDTDGEWDAGDTGDYRIADEATEVKP